ncbi:MAG: transglycosylase SLT domain-containing protein [Bacteroidales bacterium]|nr:transglycosylase SLT domain-containing protein [Bacteroidales bacterium]
MKTRRVAVCTLLALALLVVLLFPAGAASNKDRVFQALTGEGLNPAAACGIMANIEKESQFDPTATSGGGSYGLCQWTGSRKSNLYNYCNKNGLAASSVEGQVAFLMYELKTGYQSVYNSLKGVSNTAEGAYNAGYRFCYDFERPANKSSRASQRGSLARSTYWPAYSKVAAAMNGFLKGEDGLWAVYKDGKVDTSVTSIVKNQYGWWRVVDGYADFTANSIYKNENGWYKCTDGKVTFQENGIYKNENGWFKCTNSRVTFDETGVFANEKGLWYCINSKVAFDFNGTVLYDGVTYNVVNGFATPAPAL